MLGLFRNVMRIKSRSDSHMWHNKRLYSITFSHSFPSRPEMTLTHNFIQMQSIHAIHSTFHIRYFHKGSYLLSAFVGRPFYVWLYVYPSVSRENCRLNGNYTRDVSIDKEELITFWKSSTSWYGQVTLQYHEIWHISTICLISLEKLAHWTFMTI